VVTRSVRHELQVVGRVLVVRRDVETHHPLEERFRGGVVREEGVAVDVVQLALTRVRATLKLLVTGRGEGRIEAEELVEPLLNRVSGGVTNRRGELDLLQLARDGEGLSRRRTALGGFGVLSTGGRGREGGSGAGHLAELLEELEGEGTTSSFVTVDGRCHEDEVRAEEGADEGERDGGGFVDDDELSLTEDVVVLRLDVL
jgi:hypothetical protein